VRYAKIFRKKNPPVRRPRAFSAAAAVAMACTLARKLALHLS